MAPTGNMDIILKNTVEYNATDKFWANTESQRNWQESVLYLARNYM